MEKVEKIADSAFLVGKYVYLRPPDIEKDVLKGTWAMWFNDPKVTNYLIQGAYPNTVEQQVEYVKSVQKDPTRLVLSIINKEDDKHIGVISFSNIDFFNRRSRIALVIGERKYHKAAPLEAMALLTKHGFERLNLNKIDASQCEGLWVWLNSLELIGYTLEGYFKAAQIRDGEVRDGVYTGVTAERYFQLKKERKGDICGADILDLMANRRKENIALKLKDFIHNELYRE